MNIYIWCQKIERFIARHISCLFRQGNPDRGHYIRPLYTLRPEGIGCYFSDNVQRAVEISVNVPLVRCTIEAALHSFSAKGGLLTIARSVTYRERITVLMLIASIEG